MEFFKKEKTHTLAWIMSLLALPIATIGINKGMTPLQLISWLSVVVVIQLLHLLPRALEVKEVYNDDIDF